MHRALKSLRRPERLRWRRSRRGSLRELTVIVATWVLVLVVGSNQDDEHDEVVEDDECDEDDEDASRMIIMMMIMVLIMMRRTRMMSMMVRMMSMMVRMMRMRMTMTFLMPIVAAVLRGWRGAGDGEACDGCVSRCAGFGLLPCLFVSCHISKLCDCIRARQCMTLTPTS